MISKTIIIGLVAVAFVAGSILAGTMAYAAGDKNGKPFEALWTAIHEIELTPGPQGIQGDPGTNGEDGTNGDQGTFPTIYRVTASGPLQQNGNSQASPNCDSGDSVLGGGVDQTGGTFLGAYITESHPTPTGWFGFMDGRAIDVTVICADTASPFR